MPGSEPDVTYAYDNLGRLTSASQTGHALNFTYDALSRNLTQAGPQGTVTSEWDLAGRRTRLTYPGGVLYVDYDYLVTGDMTRIRENGASSGIGVLATFAYDDLGRRTSTTFGNGVVTRYTFDPVSRLASLTQNLAGTNNDLSATFAYNPSSQITSTVRTGDAYAWTGHFNQNAGSTVNGLNQIANYGAKTVTHDSKGNITAIGTRGFTYSSENLLLTGPNSTTLGYDPVMRLHQLASATTTRFAYDGLDRIAEYDGSNALQRRYVHGPNMDEPLVWYEGSGTSDRRFLSSDERGSVISVTDGTGTVLALNRYDEFGQPQSGNLGAFGYTGQAWFSDINAWYYKARVYDPEPGRFLQPDPIGYEGDGPNLYAYVLNDPVNFSDPLGLELVDFGTAVAQRRFEPFSFIGPGANALITIPSAQAFSSPGEGASTLSEQITVVCDAACRARGRVPQKPKPRHRYPFSGRITPSNTGCTLEDAIKVLNFYAVPGSDGPKVSGQTYEARATLVTALGYTVTVRLGNVSFQSELGGLQVRNTTLGDHLMRHGSVVMRLVGSQQSGYGIVGVRYGTNLNSALAKLNQEFGPGEFKNQINKMAEALKTCQ